MARSIRNLLLTLPLVLSTISLPTKAEDLQLVAATDRAKPDEGSIGDLRTLDAAYEKPDSSPGQSVLTADDQRFLDLLEWRGVHYFIDSTDPVTGLMSDRSLADGSGQHDVASIASVGFGLTAYCIAAERGWMPKEEVYERSLKTLTFIRDHAPKDHGTFYHFLEMRTGKRTWQCEASNIDTALLMAGALTVRQYFPDTELSKLCDQLYRDVDWAWLLRKDGTLGMGFRPGEGFIKASWSQFNEGPLIYLLALGSPTHPVPPASWKSWKREPVVHNSGLTYLNCPPLFTQQYPQCWFDLRNLHDDYADYYRNSQLATLAQRQWSIDELSKKFPAYGPDYWGITASDYDGGYRAWGGPPTDNDIDGSVVPCAAAGSLAFEPRVCLDMLESLHHKYGAKGFLKYGFVDAMNPAKGWYNGDVLGIDVGPGVIMAENCRSGFVWKTFMSSSEAQAAIKLAGFRSNSADDVAAMKTTSLISSSVAQSKASE